MFGISWETPGDGLLLTIFDLSISISLLIAAFYLSVEWKDWRGFYLKIMVVIQLACSVLFILTFFSDLTRETVEIVVQWLGYSSGNALIILLAIDRFLITKGVNIKLRQPRTGTL